MTIQANVAQVSNLKVVPVLRAEADTPSDRSNPKCGSMPCDSFAAKPSTAPAPKKDGAPAIFLPPKRSKVPLEAQLAILGALALGTGSLTLAVIVKYTAVGPDVLEGIMTVMSGPGALVLAVGGCLAMLAWAYAVRPGSGYHQKK